MDSGQELSIFSDLKDPVIWADNKFKCTAIIAKDPGEVGKIGQTQDIHRIVNDIEGPPVIYIY